MIANAAVESRHRAVFIAANFVGNGDIRNDFSSEFDAIWTKVSGHLRLATAHWRQESDFVAGTQSGAPSGKFLVACSDQRRAKFPQFGSGGAAFCKQIFNFRTLLDFDRLFG
jgi:hypothetical protein